MQALSHVAILFHVFALVAGDATDGITPTAPGPGEIYNSGSTIPIRWEPGPNWSNFSIFLMSGSNDQMQPVTVVATGLDSSNSTLSPCNWTCPDVQPYSAIYFFQFTNGEDKQNSKWTTRFTIASPSGETTPPEHSTQSNGDAVPWGVGSLSNSSSNTVDAQDADSSTGTKSSSESAASSDLPNSSSRMHKVYTISTSAEAAPTDRQATPTISFPSESTGPVRATIAALRPGAQTVSSAKALVPDVFGVWAVSVLVLATSLL